jgi:hypothetical protein
MFSIYLPVFTYQYLAATQMPESTPKTRTFALINTCNRDITLSQMSANFSSKVMTDALIPHVKRNRAEYRFYPRSNIGTNSLMRSLKSSMCAFADTRVSQRQTQTVGRADTPMLATLMKKVVETALPRVTKEDTSDKASTAAIASTVFSALFRDIFGQRLLLSCVGNNTQKLFGYFCCMCRNTQPITGKHGKPLPNLDRAYFVTFGNSAKDALTFHAITMVARNAIRSDPSATATLAIPVAIRVPTAAVVVQPPRQSLTRLPLGFGLSATDQARVNISQLLKRAAITVSSVDLARIGDQIEQDLQVLGDQKQESGTRSTLAQLLVPK